MRSLSRLSHVVRSVTLASLAASLGAACGGSTTSSNPTSTGDGGTTLDGATPDGSTDGGIVTTGFDKTVCSAGNVGYEPLEGVTAGKPVDFLELRSQWGMDGSDPPPTKVASEGTPCATAANPAKCQSDLAALFAVTGWKRPSNGGEPENFRYVVYTRGDEVGVVDTLEELAAFVAPIENPKDAALLLQEEGYYFECPSLNVKALQSGYELIAFSGTSCGAENKVDRHRISVSLSGDTAVLETALHKKGDPGCAIGRRPDGLVECAITDVRTSVGAFFAAAARLEAASIPAFEILARELEHHGAPRALVDEALASRDDEIRHARVVEALAHKYGVEVQAPEVTSQAPRSLFALALDNAVEGCVRETFGAVVASLQAARAGDREAARALAEIAVDETRHAALSWDIDVWARGHLTEEENVRLDAAQAAALRELEASVEAPLSHDTQSLAGMPDPKLARLAFERFERELFAT